MENKFKYVNDYKTFENFLDKFRTNNTSILPKPAEINLTGKKIGEIQDISEIQGKTLIDHDTELQLYINEYSNRIELIDPEDNNGKGKVIFEGYLPEPGHSLNYDNENCDNAEEFEEDCDTCPDCYEYVYLDDSFNMIEFIIDNKVEYSFSLRESEDITSAFEDDVD